jgi:hypothetical protein
MAMVLSSINIDTLIQKKLEAISKTPKIVILIPPLFGGRRIYDNHAL